MIIEQHKTRPKLLEKDYKKAAVLVSRLSGLIVLLTKEHPILPLSFNFNGSCLLQKLKAE